MRLFHTVVRHLHLGTLAFAAAGVLCTGTASAQIGELAGFTEVMHPEYLRRDLAIFDSALRLDSTQRDILENLFEDYGTNFEQGLEGMQERLKNMKDELQASDQNRILSMIFVPFEEWGQERRSLGDDFLLSVQVMLNEEQLERWPSFLRRLTRDKTLSNGVLSGESLDLLVLANDLDLEQRLLLTLQPVLDEYEMALDDQLRRRNQTLSVTQAKMVEALQQQNAERSLNLIDQQLAARKALREVNDRYIEIIAAALPGDYSTEFRQRARERAYGKAYRPTAGQRMYQAAVELPDLDEETLQSLLDLQEAHNLEMGSIADRVAEAIRSFEPLKVRNRIEMFVVRISGGKGERITDPSIDEFRKREEMDSRFIALLQAVLTEEQFQSLDGADAWLRRQQSDRAREEAAQRRLEAAERKADAQQDKSRARGGKPDTGRDRGRARTERDPRQSQREERAKQLEGLRERDQSNSKKPDR